MRLSGLLLLGFLEKTQAGIGDGRHLARLVMPWTTCEAKDGELELGESICPNRNAVKNFRKILPEPS